MKGKYKFEILKSKRNGQFYWNVTHRNGNEICRSSETYKKRGACLKGFIKMCEAIAAGEITHLNPEEAITKLPV